MSKPERLHSRKEMKQRRRALRNNATPAEKCLWNMLRKRQLKGRKFRRQYSIGRYVLDFYCPDEHLAVELDGNVHSDPTHYAYDDARERFLRKQGLKVVRFENQEVFETPESVLEAICWHFRADTDPKRTREKGRRSTPCSPPISGGR